MRRAPLVRVLAALALACVLGAAWAKETLAPGEIALPAHEALTAPPRVALDGRGRALLSLPVAGGIDFVAASDDTNRSFGGVVHAIRRDGLFAGGCRGPRIAASRSAVVIAAISMRNGDAGGDLYAWRSADGGATWGEALRVSDVAGCAAEGLFDLAALADGRFAIVWLDGRTKGTRVRADFSSDGSQWGEDVLVYESPGGSVCECCAPAVAAADDGGGIAAFRNSVDGDRDIWTARLPKGATQFEAARKSGAGAWKLAACPMAAPSVATRGADVVSAWRRADDVYLVTGAAQERELGRGTEPQIVLRDDGVHVVWLAAGTLVHLAPRAKKPDELASNAAAPCAVSPADRSRAGLVAWLDTATKRARLAEVR